MVCKHHTIEESLEKVFRKWPNLCLNFMIGPTSNGWSCRSNCMMYMYIILCCGIKNMICEYHVQSNIFECVMQAALINKFSQNKPSSILGILGFRWNNSNLFVWCRTFPQLMKSDLHGEVIGLKLLGALVQNNKIPR